MITLTRCPSCDSASGKAPVTSAKPPVFAYGATSEATITTRKDPLPDAKDWEGKPGKLDLLQR